jgi:hypothetical protein
MRHGDTRLAKLALASSRTLGCVYVASVVTCVLLDSNVRQLTHFVTDTTLSLA